MQRIWCYCVTALLALWWGGLTFYAAFVVPLGAEMFSGLDQGFLTQQVTVRLNVLGTLVPLLLAGELWRRNSRSKWRWSVVASLILVQAILWYWHGRLGAMMAPESRSLLSEDSFYGEHRVYLWLTAVQWLLGFAGAPVDFGENEPTTNKERLASTVVPNQSQDQNP